MKKSLFLVLLALAALPAAAETRSVPASREQIQLSYAPIVKSVAPAVVNIYTRKVVQKRVMSPFLNDPFFQQFFGGALPQGLTRQRLENSLGSGVIVRPDGLIVTSYHVIKGADQITAVLADRREFEASLVSQDDRSDLAVLRIDAKGESLPHLELRDSDEAQVGDLVLAIGNPFGVGQTVTSGIVSGVARTSVDINDINYFIQTDAAINPGNSGGALVTMDGKLVGINAAIFSRSGGNMGLGFAVPSNMVRTVIGAVATGKKNVVRPWLGVSGQEVTPEVAASMNLPRPVGILVNAIHPASPAVKAGLKIGDVIVSVNGKEIEDPGAFRYRVATIPVDSEAELGLVRAGQKATLPVKMIAPPENPPREATKIKGANPLAGAVIANLSPAVSEERNLHGVDKGVVVLSLSEDAPAARLGLEPGDIIQSVNGAAMATVGEVVEALKQKERGWRLGIRRGDSVTTVLVR